MIGMWAMKRLGEHGRAQSWGPQVPCASYKARSPDGQSCVLSAGVSLTTCFLLSVRHEPPFRVHPMKSHEILSLLVGSSSSSQK